MVLPERYSLDNLKMAVQEPKYTVKKEFRNVHRKLLISNYSKLFRSTHKEGEVMTNEWDNLVILDACRLDMFKNINILDGNMNSKMVDASNSSEFVERYFKGRTYHDTVLVTGNPHSPKPNDRIFHDVIFVEVRNSNSDMYPGPPMENTSIVPPEDIISNTIKAHEQNPKKRIIIHFMQPHLPFIGKKGRELYLESIKQAEENVIDITKGKQSWVTIDIYKTALSDNFKITIKDIQEAYQENLRIILEHVELLTSELNGKTIITADHGELLGDRILGVRYFGHPPGIRMKELSIVPWFTVESSSRRDITANPPEELEPIDEDVQKEQLKALGYK